MPNVSGSQNINKQAAFKAEGLLSCKTAVQRTLWAHLANTKFQSTRTKKRATNSRTFFSQLGELALNLMATGLYDSPGPYRDSKCKFM